LGAGVFFLDCRSLFANKTILHWNAGCGYGNFFLQKRIKFHRKE
jgi:hypothetical protein